MQELTMNEISLVSGSYRMSENNCIGAMTIGGGILGAFAGGGWNFGAGAVSGFGIGAALGGGVGMMVCNHLMK
jgi:hypothetical protein